MIKADNVLYRKIVLKLLRHSNIIGVVMVIVAIYVCFAANTWLYAIIFGLSSIYLGWLTGQYIISESKDLNKQECDLQYGCQIASFNSRLSIVSNTTIVLFGLAFTALLFRYLLSDSQEALLMEDSYVIGFVKLMLMYIMSDKIHTSQLLVSILYRYSQTIRFLNIDIDKKHPERRYPVIFLDGAKISSSRYRVTGYTKVSTVVFNPQLSLGDNSAIEYKLIEPDEKHVVHDVPIYDKYETPSCFFRCHVVLKKVDEPSTN